MRDRSKVIEPGQANERRAKFKRAGKLGQENDHSMQVPILPAWAIFLSSNLRVESQQVDDATPSERPA
jgi:hypothetical protein